MKRIFFIAAILLISSCSKEFYSGFRFKWKEGVCKEVHGAHITERQFNKMVCGQKWAYYGCRHILDDGNLEKFKIPSLYGGVLEKYEENNFHSSVTSIDISKDNISYRYWDGEMGKPHDVNCQFVFSDSRIYNMDDGTQILRILDVDDEFMYCLEEHNPNTQAGVMCISLYIHYENSFFFKNSDLL